MIPLKISTIFVAFLTFANSARILGVFPGPGYSQFILAESLLTALTERGHEVTVISPFAPKVPPKNYTTIDTSGFLEVVRTEIMDDLFEFLEYSDYKVMIDIYLQLGPMMAEYTLAEPEVQKLIHSDATFDLVIVEQVANEALFGFAHHFKAPLIVFSSLGANEWTNDLMGNPAFPSYVPNCLTGYTANMNFLQRLHNLMLTTFESLFKEFLVYPTHEKILQKYFPNAPKLEDIIYNISLVLLSSHPAVWEPVPLVQNMIQIGGFHVAPEPLPKKLKQFLDEANEGVVLFSMGTNLRSKDISTDMRQQILEVFSKLKQKVLWKFEDENLPDLPKNVRISKWLPQRAVLAHPNTKAFISHCGFLSTTESVFYGVPRVCIPIFGDQQMNAAFMEKTQVGVTLQFRDINKDNLLNALDKVLNDKKYAENVKQRSKTMQDTPIKPMDLAMFWIEYVLRHRGAPHLKSVALDLPFYKRWTLDVVFFMVAIVVLLFTTTSVVIRRITRCNRNVNKSKKNN